MESKSSLWSTPLVEGEGVGGAPGMTIKDILEKVDLFNISVEDDAAKQKNFEKNSQGKTIIQVSDPTSAYLGPKLWEKQIPFSLDFEDMNQMNDVMDMEDFLAENNINLDFSKDKDQTVDPNKYRQRAQSMSSMELSPEAHLDPDSPPPIVSEDQKPVIRPSIIVEYKKGKEENKNSGSLPKGDNGFLYAESKRARKEREKEERRKRLEMEIEFAPEDLALATVPGVDFNPKERAFDMEELRPQPIIRKRKKTYVPEESKDDRYWENRMKNNVAARRSREARRLKENQIALRAAFLEKENKVLRKELGEVNFANSKLNTEKEILKMKLAKYEALL